MAYVDALDASDTVVVWATHVEKMLLSDVALRLGKSEEWPDVELLEGMREHYPRIEMGSEVVVIHHLPPDAYVKAKFRCPGQGKDEMSALCQ